MKRLLFLIGCLACIGSVAAQNVVEAEFFIDNDPGFGLAIPISVTPGTDVTLNFSPDVSGLPGGFHTFYVRAKDENGRWSSAQSFAFYKAPSISAVLADVVAAEYFIDTDPGRGQGIAIPGITPGSDVTIPVFSVDLNGLLGGFHTLYVRSRDVNGLWSISSVQTFYKTPAEAGLPVSVNYAEYFFDTDPGFGSATPVPSLTPGSNVSIPSFSIDLGALAGGFHTLYMRSRDQLGRWSILHSNAFFKAHSISDPLADVTNMEYFIDTDPGFGLGISVAFTVSSDVTIPTFSVDLAGVSGGFHTLHIRSQDSDGNWSTIESRAFYKSYTINDPLADVSRAEYFIDKDPGVGLGTAISSSAGNDVQMDFAVDLNGLGGGFHTLYVRSADSDGYWSTLQSFAFYKTPTPIPGAPLIASIEYFFYKAGGPSTTRVFKAFTPSQDVTVNFSPFTAGLEIDSSYTMHVYGVDSNGNRSLSSYADIIAPLRPNNPPVVALAIGDVTLSEDFGSAAIVALDSVFADADSAYGDVLQYTVQVTPAIATAGLSQNLLSLTSLQDENGLAQVIVTATDDSGAVVADTFNVQITAVNDKPIASNDAVTAPSGVATVFKVLANDTDVDGPILSIAAIVTGVSHGTLSITSDTTLTYTSAFGYSGSDAFTYSVTDGAGGLDTASVTVTVNAPAPLAVTTAVHQNPALTKYADVFVVADTVLAAPPSVKMFVGGDSSSLSMSTVSTTVYKGSFQFTQNGSYSIRTQATSIAGSQSTTFRSYTVTLARPDAATEVLSADARMSLIVPAGALGGETYLMSSEEVDDRGATYEVSPGVELRRSAEIWFGYDQVTDPGKLRVFHEVNGAWIPIQSRVYLKEKRVRAVTGTLGKFKLVYDETFSGNNVVPVEFALNQNYPNPFNPSTTISFDLASDGPASLTIYNVLGQRVRTLVEGGKLAGTYHVTWDTRNDAGIPVGSGIYFYRLEVPGFTKTRKMLFIK